MTELDDNKTEQAEVAQPKPSARVQLLRRAMSQETERSPQVEILLRHQKRFEPGQSGNPDGRPRSRRVNKALLGLLDAVDEKSGLTGAEAIAKVWMKEALKGNIFAIREILDRTEGKVPNLFIGDVTHSDVSKIKEKLMAKLIRHEELPEAKGEPTQ